jgi:hypothetical protein
MARECDKCDVLIIGSNSLDLLSCVQCPLQRCVACETALAIKAHQSLKSIVRGNADWTCRNCLKPKPKRHAQTADKKGKKQPAVAQAAVEAKKGKKKQQGASAAAAINDDDGGAAFVDNAVVGNVCPSCKQSTESSQLDGTRQCEGQYYSKFFVRCATTSIIPNAEVAKFCV